MSKLKQFILGLSVCSLAVVMCACATVQPDDRVRAEVTDAMFAKTGDTVHLFYGMSKKAKEEFCLGATVPVYRFGKGYYVSKSEVGKIKVTKDLGEHYIQAVVVEGEVRSGDIAMQPNSECLIRLLDHDEK
jgi:hypothetical protein